MYNIRFQTGTLPTQTADEQGVLFAQSFVHLGVPIQQANCIFQPLQPCVAMISYLVDSHFGLLIEQTVLSLVLFCPNSCLFFFFVELLKLQAKDIPYLLRYSVHP